MSDFGLTLALQNMYSGPSQQEKQDRPAAGMNFEAHPPVWRDQSKSS